MNRDSELYALFSKLRQFGRLQIGRLLGSRLTTDGGYKAWLDLLERCYFMRVELNALAGLLIAKGAFTHAEWQAALETEATAYVEALAKQWPEVTVKPDGFTINDIAAMQRRSKAERWPP